MRCLAHAVLALALIVAPTLVLAQGLPTPPRFATRPANDNSAYAASTGYVDGAVQTLQTLLNAINASKAPIANPAFTGTASATGSISAGTCDPMSGSFLVRNDQAYPQAPFITTCNLVKSAPGASVPFGSNDGLASLGNYQVAAQLIQMNTTQNYNRQENALAIIFNSKTGDGDHDTTNGDFSEKAAAYISALVMPGAANTWVMNTVLKVLDGVSLKRNIYHWEQDHSNYRGPAFPDGRSGTVGNIVGQFLNYTGYPMTAGQIWAGGTNNGPGHYGSVSATTTSQSTTISFSNPNNDGLTVGDLVEGAGIPPWTYVDSINGDNTAKSQTSGTAVLTQAATASGSVSLQVTTYALFGGAYFNGTNLIRDAIWTEGVNSQNVLKSYGTHYAIIDAGSASVKYALISPAGAKTCLNGADGCISYKGSNVTRFEQNGGQPLTLIGGASGVNGVALTSAASGTGPLAQPDGPDTNIPLNLAGKGLSPVQVLGGLSATGAINGAAYSVGGATGVSCSGAPSSFYAVTYGIVTHC